jgi:prepilin-type N-terminal cleavage/methylation domain-containing protein
LQFVENMQHGFSLVEVVVATALVGTGAIAVAQLTIVATRANRVARSTTATTVIAEQKMEELQSAEWAGLTVSPSGTLGRNTDGYCDFIDGDGRKIGSGTVAPTGAVFVRRWAIDRLTTAAALVLQVSVVPVSDAGGAGAAGPRRLEEARIVGIKNRP